jgi:hypothetical protein
MNVFRKIAVVVLVISFFAIAIPVGSIANPDKVKLANGTPVVLRLTEEISSKTKSINDLVNFEVARDVIVDGKIVIKSGTPATATISLLEKSGMAGEGGNVQVSLEATKSVDGQRIPLRATVNQAGKDEKGLAIGGGVICCPLLLLMSGKHAVIPEGTEVKAYTEADMVIDVP